MLKEIFLLFLTIFVAVNCNYCTDDCQFTLSFDDQFQVPENCPKSYGHTFLICHSDFQLDYVEKTIDVNMYAEGIVLTNEVHYQMDIISNFEPSIERMTARLQYSCTLLDDCARAYTLEKFETLFSHTPVLYSIKDNLYNVGSSNVQQCYDLENKTVDCKNGLCRAELGSYLKPDDPFTPIPYYKTYCDYYPPDDPFKNKTGLISTNTYGLPTSRGIFDTLHYVCNRNLCNNYENIELIQNLLEIFNNYSINITTTAATTTVSSAVMTTISSSIIITTSLLLFAKHFFLNLLVASQNK
jgi:hypothetical protein